MANKAEYRSYSFEVRAEEKGNKSIITGRPIVYNSPTKIGGYFIEIIEKDALVGTDLKDVRFLVNHNLEMIPLARSRRNNGNSTMQLTVDQQGLFIEVELDTENNADARALYSAVSRGDISGMSFMFYVEDEEWDDIDSEMPTRRIKKIATVVEVSAVTMPAYEATEINARSKEALENARSLVDTIRQQNANPVDTGSNINETENILELEKAKFRFKSNY